MKIGWAYMGIAAILIIGGALLAFDGYDPYGDLILLASLPFIYIGSNSLADDRKAATAADDDDSEE